LDGVPEDQRVTYIVTGRHPLDSAVSLYHQGDNIDRSRMRALTGQPEPDESEDPPPRRPLHEWLLRWIEGDENPREQPDSLPGVMHHLGDAWSRRHQPNVVLVHYDDLSTDLAAEMRRIAVRLEIDVPEKTWPALVDAAGFQQMRSNPENAVPDPSGVLKDNAKFFRRGTSGAGREVLTDDEYASYLERVEQLAPGDLLSWLHHQ
jgi:hypothetical protein